MKYQSEKVMEIWDEIENITDVAHKELNLNGIVGEKSLNKQWYETVENNGNFFIVTARTANNKLVGYASYFLTSSPLSFGLLQAESNSFFMLKEYRRGFNGINLLKFAEQKLKILGAKFIIQKVNTAHDTSILFERMSYNFLEKVYIKEIE